MISSYIKKTYKLSAIALIFAVSSCDVLEPKYYMGQAADELFKSPDGIKSASTGMYDIFQHSEFLGGRMQIYSDIRGVDVNPSPFFSGLSSFNLSSSDGFIQNAWTGAYRAIYECNLFIENLSRTNGVITDDEKSSYYAEARFLRGVCYFYMVNFWGQQYTQQGDLGVPLVLRTYDGTSSVNGSAAQPRASVEKVYQQIVDDLEFAEKNLPLSWNDEYRNRVRATSSAASAMLSRVYLYLKDYDKCIEEANKVISPSSGNRKFQLATDLKADCFSSNQQRLASKEIIFWIAMSSSDNPGANNSLGQHYGANNRADISVSKSYLNLLEKGDKRLDLLTLKNGMYFCNKYPNGTQDWAPIIRYSEVLLNKAEALAKLSSSIVDANALQIINSIRARSSATPLLPESFSSKHEFINTILDERRRELAFEGNASFDLFRNERGIPSGRGTSSAAEIPYPSNLFAAPIPSTDMQRNKNLVQNNGY